MALSLLCLVVLGAPGGAWEQAQADRALVQTQLQVDPAPEGKRIAFVRTVRYEVFLEDEPFFTWPNWFHALTREPVLLRELLVKKGDRWNQERVDETVRNLRGLIIFQAVRAVAVRTSEPDAVGLLLVTRDLWSLRFEQDFQFTGAKFDNLLLQMTERNLLGRNKRATVRYILGPTTYSFGGLYFDRRLFGSPTLLTGSGDVLLDRRDDGFDGFIAGAELARPLYSLEQAQSWRIPVTVQRFVRRRAQRGVILEWDDPETEEVEAIPQVWRRNALAASFLHTTQIPGAMTQRYTLGYTLSHLTNRPNEETALPAENRESFERNVLPPSRNTIGPSIGYSIFERRFRSFTDLASFGVSEDVQIGPSAGASLTYGAHLLGSTEDAVLFSLSTGWSFELGSDGLLGLAFGTQGRWPGGEAQELVHLARARMATPRAFGRFILRADWLGRQSETVPGLTSLGGDNGLRGYPAQHIIAFGADRVRTNLEWRSPPLAISFLRLGGVLFYDAGSVYKSLDEVGQLATIVRPEGETARRVGWHQTVGVGLRAFMPQLNRSPFRLDLGLPVDGSGFGLTLSGGGEQAVPITAREDSQFDFSVGGVSNQP